MRAVKKTVILPDGRTGIEWEEIPEEQAATEKRSAEALAQIADIARRARDGLLSQTDWTQLRDVTLPQAVAARVKTYRQELRDLPTTEGWPDAVVWPVNPLGDLRIK